MLNRIAVGCTQVLLDREIIERSRMAIYIYGFELFFSTVFATISMITIAFVSGRGAEGLTFILFFMPIRMAAGGYHAETYGKCFVLTNLIFIFQLILCSTVFQWIGANGCFLLFVGALLYICLNAPIVNHKHPISEIRQRNNRVRSRQFSIVEFCVVLLFYYGQKTELLVSASVATLFVAGMMLAAKERG